MVLMERIQIFKSKKYIQYFNFYTCLLLVFCLPFWSKILPPLIIVWIFTWLLEGDFKNRFKLKDNISPFLLIIGFYVWHAIGLFYTDNFKSGFFDLEVKMLIIVFPFLFLGVNYLFIKKRLIIFKTFVFGNLFAALMCTSIATYNVYIHFCGEGNSNEAFNTFFFYTGLSYFMHPSYFAMYLIFSLVIIEYLFYNKLITNNLLKAIYFSIALFFVVFIYFLSSRASIIAFLAISVGLLILYFYKTKKILIKIISLIILILIGFIMINNPRFTLMVKNDFSKNNIETVKILNTNKESSDAKTDESSNVRLQIWKSAINISSKNILLGVGTGDIKDALMAEYIKCNNKDAKKNNLNVHNQFLETQMGQGIIGFMLLTSLFFIAILRSYIDKNRLLFLFIIIIGINFLFESMLNTQAGVIFFSFFFSFLIFTVKKPVKGI